MQGDDGSRPYETWSTPHDSALGFDCMIIAAADGKKRCLPSVYVMLSGYFSDGSCTAPLARADAGCPPAYALGYLILTSNACLATYGYSVFPLGSSYAGTTFYSLDSSTPPACVRSTSAPYLGTGEAFFTVGAEIEPTNLVAFTEVSN